jgi:hypothetical protein
MTAKAYHSYAIPGAAGNEELPRTAKWRLLGLRDRGTI